MNRVLAMSAMALLATTTLTVVPEASAMPYAAPQISASSQLVLVDDDDDRDDLRYIDRFRGDCCGWSRFRGKSSDEYDDEDEDEDD